MQLIFLLILERSRTHTAFKWILINVCFYMSLQVVRLCELFLTNLQKQFLLLN